ncbi:DUF402 domain-containing protein [Streptomyces sp. AM2-3-1]|uniref:DUF402 domain-containing protein n=1 Tax=Streptomyces sp. AM2-3-1 TaxID=3075824 RepID=UPI0028C39E34|nr:DUF402 domain-containing protein [Streptomyces sp. AM2-3-1]WNO62326.1 DUF402 domain-containing protein [Streptomyces sp. AM2-3-1]WNO69620.1 DUF402 domain-containing protein [Streptomyces sp. AM2-3-1]
MVGHPSGCPYQFGYGRLEKPVRVRTLVPRGEWWTATFCVDPGPEMYCDVCTVSEWNADGTVVRTVDLDLDVVRPRGGEAHVEDEDEFAVRAGR